MANLDIYKVNLDTPQPNGRKGESPRAAFTKYNDLIEALGSEIEQAGFYVSQTPPDNPVSYMQWVDTSVDPAVLRRWDSVEAEWVEIGPVLRSLGTLSEVDVGTGAEEVRINSENDTRFIQGGDVVQTTGDSPDDVMSQKAATDTFVHQGGDAELNDLTVGGDAELNDLTVGGDAELNDLTVGGDANFSSMLLVGGSPIIENGENSNGRWIKWADGTILMSGTKRVYNTTADTTVLRDSLDFPHNLSTIDGAVFLPIVLSNDYDVSMHAGGFHAVSNTNYITTTGISRIYIRRTQQTEQFGPNDYAGIDWVVIGRWK